MATTMTEIPIKDLALTTAPAGKQLLVRDASAGLQRIDYAQIAKNLVESYGSSSLAGKNQSIKAAIDSLNSGLTQNTSSISTINDSLSKQKSEINSINSKLNNRHQSIDADQTAYIGSGAFIIYAHGSYWGSYGGLYLLYTGSSFTIITVIKCEHLKTLTYNSSNYTLNCSFDSWGGKIDVIRID